MCDLVREPRHRERLLATCFADQVGRLIAQVFEGFAACCYEARFASIAFAVHDLLALKDALQKKDVWDGLFFNNANYYDFWALNFKDFQFSCWHSNNVKKLINIL